MKTQHIISAFFMVFSAIVITGCSPKFYAPNSSNVPLLTEKGEFLASAGTDGNRGELQLAYAAANHIGIVANGSLFFPREEDNGNGGKGSLFEAGVGYFLPLENHFVFETYALAGFGTLENRFPSSVQTYPGTDGKLNANVLRFAVQPSFGYKSKYFEAGISTRAGLVNYNSITGSLVTSEGNQQLFLEGNNSQLMLEPALTLRGGYDFLKLQLQMGSSINMTRSDFPQDKSWLTLGLNYRMQR